MNIFRLMFSQYPYLVLKTMPQKPLKIRSTISSLGNRLNRSSYNIFIFALLMFASNFLQAGTLTASVDRNRININETLIFTLGYDEQVSTSQTNFNALRQDFEVLSVRPQSSNNVSIINGQTTREISTTWTLTLAPRKEGTLVIPSFNINGDVSDAIRIDVGTASSNSPQDQPILVILEVDQKTAYVGQQLIINVEIMAQSTVSNLSGEGLKLDDAEVELVNRQSFQRVDNGIAWQVEQLSYAIFPDQAGILAIPALLFSGLKADQTQSRNRFDPFAQQRGQRIAARSQAIAIEILPTPNNTGTAWLPASALEIQSSWSGDTSQIRVGEPITRMIEIVVLGQRASMIPPLEITSSPLYKSYKDQPQIENKPSSDFGIVGIRIESEAIVPSLEGLLELPEQSISWWSTESNSWQETVLPAESLEVLPAIAGTSFAPPATAPLFLSETSESNTIIANEINRWWQIATGLLSLICVIQLWIILRSKSNKNSSTSSVKKNHLEEKPSEKQAWRQLDNALKSSDSHKIKVAILQWAQLYFGNGKSLSLHSLPSKIASNIVGYSQLEQFKAQLMELDASLYKGQSSLELQQLQACLENLRLQLSHANKNESKNTQLAPLYPN